MNRNDLIETEILKTLKKYRTGVYKNHLQARLNRKYLFSDLDYRNAIERLKRKKLIYCFRQRWLLSPEYVDLPVQELQSIRSLNNTFETSFQSFFFKTKKWRQAND